MPSATAAQRTVGTVLLAATLGCVAFVMNIEAIRLSLSATWVGLLGTLLSGAILGGFGFGVIHLIASRRISRSAKLVWGVLFVCAGPLACGAYLIFAPAAFGTAVKTQLPLGL